MAKILLADDSAFMRKILTNILTKGGYKDIIETEDGAGAVEKYKKEKPALVLLDIIMEKKDGIQALKEIVAYDKKAKVVMVSAVGQEQIVKESIKSGAKDFIVKPFDSKKVTDIVKKMLG